MNQNLPIDKIIQGNTLDVLKTFPDESIDCCITSPPYWGLRDYGTAKWEGGDVNCNHHRDNKLTDDCITGHSNMDGMVGDGIYKDICKKCGAKRIDSQIGLERTPEEYVEKMVEIFREVKRVLKKDGTLWLNLGDSYNGGGRGGIGCDNASLKQSTNIGTLTMPKVILDPNLKPKDLCGIPWRVAFALQADGWYLRQDIIWHKPNPMPESVTDRCTKAHEYIFLLAKSRKYYFDNKAIKEDSIDPESLNGRRKRNDDQFTQTQSFNNYRKGFSKIENGHLYEKRNKRSVWTVTTKPFKEAHFATFPEALIEPMVLAGCPKGGVVLDPFFGAGTTGVIANKLGRNYLGIELNPEYIKIAEKRINGVSTPLL